MPIKGDLILNHLTCHQPVFELRDTEGKFKLKITK